MKIAITTRGTTLADELDGRFGRAARFLLVDTESDTVSVIDNTQNLNAAQGAGIQAARTVWEAGAEALLTGHCGPKAFRALDAAGVAVYTGASGTAQEALEAFQSGSLARAGAADVDGHW